LRRHGLSRNDPSRKVPESSGASFTRLSTIAGFTAGAVIFFFFKLGALIIKGAKNPACKANSANAFPDGNRQLIGSIHSIGIWGIRTGAGPLRPDPVFPEPAFPDFIPFAPIY
jgi:hypothetical protein